MRSLLLVGSLLLAGCASWQQTSWQQTTKLGLDAAGSVAEGATIIGMESYRVRCEAAARTCGCAPNPAPCPCPQLERCQADRRGFGSKLKTLQAARYGGYAAILAADRVQAEGVMTTLKKLAADVAALLRALEVL